MIRVLITEDSILFGKFMKEILESDPEIQVVGWAKNGKECIEQLKPLKPDVITMDIHMPVMDGLETTEYIMLNIPTSILIVSSLVKSEMGISFKALKSGAMDVIEKPKFIKDTPLEKIGETLIERVKTIARVRPLKKYKRSRDVQQADKNVGRKSPFPKPLGKNSYGILVIGASTGGPPVLQTILKNIPPDYPFPIIITQHMASGFLKGFIEWLKTDCFFNVKTGKNNEILTKGTVYLAPDNYHIGITQNRHIFLSNTPPIGGHRPSIDFMMESAASIYKDYCMGILLTGMGRDGAKGMLSIRKSGGYTISQSEESCVIFGMPKAAIDIGATTKVCSISNISYEITHWDPQQKRYN